MLMPNKKIRGLSLVELMVAMVLGLLITAGVTQLFLTNRLTSNLQQGLASVQEQGRFAVDFLSRELMSAGYGNVDRAIYFPIDAQDEEASSSDGTLFDSVMIFLEDGEDCSGGVINEATSEDFEPVENPYKYYEVNTSDDGINTLDPIGLRHIRNRLCRAPPSGNLRPEVPHHEIRQPRIRRNDVEHRIQFTPRIEEPHTGQTQPFLKYLGRIRRHRPGRHPTHIVPMGDRGRPGEENALDKHRLRHHHVVQMRDPAPIGIVGHEHIAIAHGIAMDRHNPLHRLVEHADKARNARARRVRRSRPRRERPRGDRRARGRDEPRHRAPPRTPARNDVPSRPGGRGGGSAARASSAAADRRDRTAAAGPDRRGRPRVRPRPCAAVRRSWPAPRAARRGTP